MATSVIVLSSFSYTVPAQIRQSLPVVYLKAGSSNRSCLFYTPQTSPDWWTSTTFKSICTRTTQMYGFCDTEDSASFQNALSACIDDISAWMRSNRLQLNAAKTEVMWCGLVDACIRFPPHRSVSVPTTLRPSAPFETSAFIWTLTRP